MALTDERRLELLTYCRIDDPSPEDLVLLESLTLAAESYMQQAGVASQQPDAGRAAVYKLCVNFMVLDAWDKREMIISGSVQESPAFRRMMNQLKLTEPVSNSDTGC